jgi:hypothetical protein
MDNIQQPQPENQEQPKPEEQKQKGIATLEKIRPELNLEKWSVWQPADSRNSPKTRILHREIILPDGSKVIAKVEVGFTDKGVLTTEDQKTYYALVKNWEDKGKPTDKTTFSLRGLAKDLRKGKWGTNVIDSISKSLTRLRGTLFTWENSYYDSTTKETLEILDTFNILSELKIIKRKRDGVINKEVGYFRFNDFILKNLLANHTKPIFLDVILNFKSEIAQLLYTYLDLIMASRNHYERRTKELFDDLGLEGKRYIYPSVRKQMLNPALQELQGVRLSTGIITTATLEKTQDKKDWKIVIHKDPIKKKSRLPLEGQTEAPPESREDETSQAPEPPKDPAMLELKKQAENLVKYFYKIFRNTDEIRHDISKAIEQAATLIAQHGAEKAKYVVDFSHRAAKETDYKPRAFGGILHYVSEALADYEAWIRGEELRQKQTEQELQEQEQILKKREELLQFFQSLPPELQAGVNQEAWRTIENHSVIGSFIRQRVKELGYEKALTNPSIRGPFNGAWREIIERIRQKQQGTGETDSQPSDNTPNPPTPNSDKKTDSPIGE